MQNYLEFEKPLAEIEGKAEELRAMARANEEMDVEKEAAALDKKAAGMLKDLYKDLTPWRKCQVARHPNRPHCSEYIETLFTEYTPLAGVQRLRDNLGLCPTVAGQGEQYRSAVRQDLRALHELPALRIHGEEHLRLPAVLGHLQDPAAG